MNELMILMRGAFMFFVVGITPATVCRHLDQGKLSKVGKGIGEETRSEYINKIFILDIRHVLERITTERPRTLILHFLLLGNSANSSH